MSKLMAKIKVILTALPTWMTLIAVAITIGSEELAKALPDHAAGIIRWAATAVGLLGAAVTIIRKVTPVDDKLQQGILPQGPPASPVVRIEQKPPVETPKPDAP